MKYPVYILLFAILGLETKADETITNEEVESVTLDKMVALVVVAINVQ